MEDLFKKRKYKECGNCKKNTYEYPNIVFVNHSKLSKYLAIDICKECYPILQLKYPHIKSKQKGIKTNDTLNYNIVNVSSRSINY